VRKLSLPLILCLSALVGTLSSCAAHASKADEEPKLLNEEGVALARQGDLQRAIESFDKAAKLYRRSGDLRGELKATVNLLTACYQADRLEATRSYGGHALEIARTLKDREAEADILVTMAAAEQASGHLAEASSLASQALPLLEAAGDPLDLAKTLQVLGSTLAGLGRNEEARPHLLRVIPLWKQEGDPVNEALALGVLASIEVTAPVLELEQALRHAEEALLAFRKAKMDREEAWMQGLIASASLDLGQPAKAFAALEQELTIWERLQELGKQADVLNRRGIFYKDLHRYQEARASHERALSILKQIGDRKAQARTYLQVATAWDLLRDWLSALKAAEEALSLFDALADLEGQGDALTAIGSYYRRKGNSVLAMENLEKALDIWHRLDNREMETLVLTRLSTLYAEKGDRPQRVAFLQRARQLLTEADEEFKPLLLSNSGLVEIAERDFARARSSYQMAFELFRQHENLEGEADALVGIGDTFLFGADPARALDSYQQAIAIFERLCSNSALRDLKAGVASQSARAYEKAILAAYLLRRPEEAFELTERARARRLVETLAGLHLEGRTPTAAELLRQEQSLWIEIDRLEQHLADGTPSNETEALRRRLAALRSSSNELLGKIQVADPDAAVIIGGGSPPALRAIQERLDPDTTLVSYFKTLLRVLAFVVTRGSLEIVELPVTGKELTEVGQLLASANEGQGTPEVLAPLYSKLSRWLIDPLRDRLRTPRVGIIPHAELHQVPFAALRKGERYLGESHVLFELPSASALLLSSRPRVPLPKRMLALGYPAVKMSTEAETVATSFGGTVLIGEKATKSALLSFFREYQILHLAADAKFNRVAPLLSSITLAPEAGSEGSLQLQEVYNLDLSGTDLVVLSACESEVGAWTAGDELAALSRGFLHAGARAVIASLWRADNEATTAFMKAFYHHLKTGEGKAKALQSAQMETRKTRFKDPRYWAAFVLTGDPG
jgi:CHAT domain-containing protein/tetratricopeptide (TPR) repeat protein